MFYKSDWDNYLSYFSFNNIRINDIIEIIIFIGIFFYLIRHFKNTRMWILLKGILTMFAIYALSNIFSLKVITNLFQSIISFAIIALIMMFQPELRKILESVGNKNLSSNIKSLFGKKVNKRFTNETIQELVSSVDNMAKAKTGALILIENDIPLDEYIKSGISINSDITSQLIMNIFEKNTPLHDGAMIIRNNKIIAATCYLPLSESKNINKALGTRHRAAIGASEQTDAFVIVVSEETGAISYVENGQIKHNIKASTLAEKIQSINYEVKPTTHLAQRSTFIKNLLMSIVFGALFWLIFTVAYNPVETIKIDNIPVEIVNESVIESLDKVYEVKSGNTVNIEVTGTKDVLNSLSSSDFKATADFSKLSITNTASINVYTPKNVQIDTHNATMSIQIEDASEVELSIELQKQGTEQDGFFVYNLSTNTPTVKISGPKSIIKTIDKAVAVVNINGAHTNFETTSDIKVYDKNGSVLSNEKCEISVDNINITATVYETKEVPVSLEIIDDSKDSELEVLEKTLSAESVMVSADEKTLNSIEEIIIPVDVTNSTSNTINSIIDIRNYLPSGVQCAGENNFEYTLQIAKLITRTFTLFPNNINIKNGTGTILNSKIDIKLTFDKNTTDNINIAQLGAFVDIDGLENGTHNVPVQFENLGDIKTGSVYKVNVKVTDDEDE